MVSTWRQFWHFISRLRKKKQGLGQTALWRVLFDDGMAVPLHRKQPVGIADQDGVLAVEVFRTLVESQNMLKRLHLSYEHLQILQKELDVAGQPVDNIWMD